MIKIKKKLKIVSKNTFVPIPIGEVSKPIPFNTNLIFQKNQSYAIDTQGNKLSAYNLANHSTINSVAGAPTGVPANAGMYIFQYGYTESSWYNIGSFKVIFDLDDIYNLDYAYIWLDEGQNAPINLWGSEDGVILKPLALGVSQLPGGGWYKIEFTQQNKGGNRYFILGITGADFGIHAFVLYGRPSGTKINKGLKLSRKIVRRKFNESVGTNGFYIEHPELMGTVSDHNRFYVEPDWFMGDDFRVTGGAVGLTPDDINYKFSNSHFRNNDAVLQAFANEGTKVLFTVTTSPVCLRNIGTPDASHVKPVDPGFNYKNLAITTDPMSYTFMARIAWNLAARYGANKDIDTSLINLQTYSNTDPKPQQIKVGMKLIEAIELGNEMDKWWLGEAAYNNPQELAAYMSAIYDGHMGIMGPGYGIKNADPSMKVSIPGLAAGEDIAYVREMILWSDKYRGKGNYPWDIINYHYYNSSEGSQEVGTDTAHGLPPEQGNIMEVNKHWSNLRDTYCQSAEVWLTESGWDEHLGGVFSPKYGTQQLRSLYKGYWLTRLYLINECTGVDVTNQYWYASQGGQKLEELDPYEPNSGKFISQALVEGVNSSDDINRKPLVSYWYVATIKKLLTNYKFKHIVVQKGIRNTNENIVDSIDTNVWSLAYENEVTGETILVAWLDSASMRTLNVNIAVEESQVLINYIAGAEIRGVSDNPVLSNIKYPILNPASEIKIKQGEYINVTLTECPCLIYTNSIGTKKLIQPTNIKNQTINGTNILVTWKDSNIERVETRISYSTNPTSGFIVAYQGEITDAKYVIQNLFINTTYYTRVEILPLGSDEPEPGDDWKVLNQYELKNTNIYYASNSTKFNTVNPSINNDSVGFIEDRKGIYDLIYGGDAVPAYNKRPPIYRSTNVDRPYIIFENEPHLGFVTNRFNAITEVPHSTTIILEYKPGQDYEAILAGAATSADNIFSNSGNYLGFSNNNIRAGRANFEASNTFVEFFKRILIHVEFKQSTIDVYLDGTLRDTISHDISETEFNTKIINTLGVDTNNAPWNFFALYHSYGNDYLNLIATRNEYFSSIMDKWNVGQIVPNPHAINLSISENAGILSANYHPVNATQQQIDNSLYKWVVYGDTLNGDGGNFNNQTEVGTGDQISRTTINNLVPDPANRRRITFLVNVGGAWDYVKGPTISL